MNKRELLRMARNGEAKPAWRSRLYTVFYTYISEKQGSYDKRFDTEIRKLRPDWFKK